ncbi:MAG TPA: transglutaminase family protein [Hyphomonadaceae bacterium]|nr:transglutaminase family protein [Hyphomonadaceae bacterium]
MRLSIRHATTYTYDPPAARCALRLRLHPPTFETQRVLNWQVSVNGQVVPALLATSTGDRESIWTSSAPGAAVEVVAAGEIETGDLSGVVRGLKDSTRPGVYLRTTPLTEADKRIEALAGIVAGKSSLERLHALMAAVREAVVYAPATTNANTTAAQALKLGKGVCQDHAHVFISAARVLKVPARYVVGYLFAMDTKLTETHAWAEAYAPDIGWVGFDPANGLCPTDRYVRLACGLDSADAAPIRGSVAGTPQERLSASVDIGETAGQNQTQQ